MENSFADRLYQARKRKGKMRQEELANAVGVSKAYISQLETGARKNPDPAIVNKLAAKLMVRPEWLIDGDGDQRTPDQHVIQEIDEYWEHRVAVALVRELIKEKSRDFENAVNAMLQDREFSVYERTDMASALNRIIERTRIGLECEAGTRTQCQAQK